MESIRCIKCIKRAGSIFLVGVLLAALSLSGSAQSDVRMDILNEAELAPSSPQSEALDRLLDQIMDELLDDEMDTYTKVKTCYDYIVDNTAYGNHMGYLQTAVGDTVTCGDIYYSYGAVEGFGAVALTARTGMCNAYSSAFILFANKIGLDARLVKGSTKNSGGGYSYHEWAEVTIGETVYVFDPQLEQGLTRSGLPSHSVFCKTYEQVPGRFIRM